MMRRVLILAVLLFAVPALARRPGAVFLMIFPDARTSGLGECGVASSGLAANTYYNPAGLSSTPGMAATWSHAQWLPGLYPGMSYSYFGTAYRVTPKLGAGLNLTYLQTGETEVINEQGEFIGRYRTYDLAAQISAGYEPVRRLSAGIGVKGIYSMLVPDWVWEIMPELGISAGGRAFTVAADFGVRYRPFDWFGLGLAASNIGPDISYSRTGESDPLPAILRFGWELEPRIPGPVEIRLVSDVWRDLVTEMNIPPREAMPFHKRLVYIAEEMQFGAGLEMRFARYASIRLGYFEDIQGGRGGIEAQSSDSNTYPPYRIGLLRYLTEKGWSEPRLAGFVWGVGVEFHGFAFDIGVDDNIYAFPTRNVRFQLSWQLRPH